MNRRSFLRRTAGATALTALTGLTYGRLEAGQLRVTRQRIPVSRLPAPFAGKTVALLSDMHHSYFNDLALVRSAVDAVNALAPDLVALGGDYVHEGCARDYLDPCLRELARLCAPLGVFAVPGNHDHRAGIEPVRRGLRDHGIVDLTNAGRWIEAGDSRLRVGGVDDLWHGRQDLNAALAEATADDACLLLCHNPDYAEGLRDQRVGLVLSGHMHGGQVLLPGIGPRFLPSKYGAKYLQGLIQAPRTQVFVSGGVGTVGLPLRFRCPPEVNLLTLVRDEEDGPCRVVRKQATDGP